MILRKKSRLKKVNDAMLFVSINLKKIIAKQSFILCLCSILPIFLSNCAGVVAVGATAGASGVIPAHDGKKKIHKPSPDIITKDKITKHIRSTAKHKSVPLVKNAVPIQKSKNIALLKESLPTQSTIRIYPKYFSLKGLKDNKIKKVLGNPKLIRRDGPAKIWLYKSDTCKIHLFFFRDSRSREFFVNHIEMEVVTRLVISNDQCVINLIKKVEETG